MKYLLFIVLSFVAVSSFAQTPAASPVASAVHQDTQVVAAPAAPPKWAEELMVTVQGLPVVGPIVTKGLLYLGIVSSILTALIAFLLTALKAISGVSTLAGLADFSQKVKDFQVGKVMYYLKFFSMFNAKKPEDDAASTDQSQQESKAA